MAEIPDPPIKRKPGRPRIEIDLKRVEELAALGLTQARIAEGLGINERTIQNRKSDDEDGFIEFIHAVKRGNFKWSQQVASEIDKNRKKVPILAMMSAQQTHGLGWADNRFVRHSGQIEHTIRAVDQAWETRKKALKSPVIDTRTDTQEVVEAEYTELKGD